MCSVRGGETSRRFSVSVPGSDECDVPRCITTSILDMAMLKTNIDNTVVYSQLRIVIRFKFYGDHVGTQPSPNHGGERPNLIQIPQNSVADPRTDTELPNPRRNHSP